MTRTSTLALATLAALAATSLSTAASAHFSGGFASAMPHMSPQAPAFTSQHFGSRLASQRNPAGLAKNSPVAKTRIGIHRLKMPPLKTQPTVSSGLNRGNLNVKVPPLTVPPIAGNGLNPGNLNIKKPPVIVPPIANNGLNPGNLKNKKPPLPPLPPVVSKGPGIDNLCPFNQFKCKKGPGTTGSGPNTGTNPGPGGPNMGGNPGPGGSVIGDAPGPVVVIGGPVDVEPAVTVDPAPALVAEPQPSCAPGTIPPLAALLDELMPVVQLAPADEATVRALRVSIANLATAGDIAAARVIEEQAMALFGYGKLGLGCGEGSFRWVHRVASAR